LALKRINHYRRISGQKSIRKDQIIPGQIIQFQYSGKNKYDANPLIIFLFRDRSKKIDLMHGININYLYEHDVQQTFRLFAKHVPVTIKYDLSKKGYSYAMLEKNPNVRVGVNAQDLYTEVIKPQILATHRTSNCYRTYYYTKMVGVKLVNYKLDIIEEKIRKDTGVSKHKLKTPELYKNLQEQQIEVEVDNTKIESQNKIRKDIQE
jgi:hypothetical protein